MMQPLISIIVPVYNAEKYLNRCINSILAQTYTNFELLLINDGSKDSSGTICDKYAEEDNRIKVFHQENRGVSASRNNGIDNVTGEYITFIDSDDYINKTFLDDFELESKIDLYAQGANIIFCNNNGQNHTNKYFETKHCDLKEYYITSLNNNLILSPWSKLYKTSIIKSFKLNFDTSISWGEDRIFVLQYIQNSRKFKVISKNGYNYTQENPNSLVRARHSGYNIYNFAFKHFQLIRNIHNSNTLPKQTLIKDIYHDSLALYSSIILIIDDNYTTFANKREFINNLDDDFMKASYKCDLPRFHNFMKWTYRLFPNWLFISIIKFALKLKK